MKLIYAITLAGFAVACGPGASDSHNSSQSGAAVRGGVANEQRQQSVTLNGCLQNADKPDAGGTTTGTSGTAPQRAQGSDQAAAGKGSIGERFTLTSSGAPATSYILDGNVEALRANQDRQVRVTGMLDRGTLQPIGIAAGPRRVHRGSRRDLRGRVSLSLPHPEVQSTAALRSGYAVAAPPTSTMVKMSRWPVSTSGISC